MKTKLAILCTALVLAASSSLRAEELPQAKPCSPEFEKLKSLAGSWKGTADMGQGPVEMTLQFRLLAGGSVLEERVFAGTPNEMVTMYYEKNGKVALTHYCVLGNQPGMLLKSSDDKTLRFDFDKSCGINPAVESHMHALSISFDSPDTFSSSCIAIMDGKKMDEKATVFTRIKS